ncbi:hypothetical protein C4J81_02620 [Deltaproteobacteria bacterium Smac51]|nr:hypothetical protein C4J81_02620 [Deltaproteobacteria bacterium Smac51]
MDRYDARVQLKGKSLGLGVVLTILFGGLGMFYLSIGWGILGLLVEAALVILTWISFGFFGFLLGGWHILSVIIAVISINNHNNRILRGLD